MQVATGQSSITTAREATRASRTTQPSSTAPHGVRARGCHDSSSTASRGIRCRSRSRGGRTKHVNLSGMTRKTIRVPAHRRQLESRALAERLRGIGNLGSRRQDRTVFVSRRMQWLQPLAVSIDSYEDSSSGCPDPERTSAACTPNLGEPTTLRQRPQRRGLR